MTIRLDGHEIDVTYESRTDKPTHVNLSHHWYFNLNGHMNWGLVDDLKLIIPSEDYLETDEENIPTGRVLPVSRSPFDFRGGHFLTQSLFSSVPGGHGIDVCFAFPEDGRLKQMAVLAAPYTGRLLELKSTNPGLQVYTANWVPDTVGKYNIPYVSNYQFETDILSENFSLYIIHNIVNYPTRVKYSINFYSKSSPDLISNSKLSRGHAPQHVCGSII